MIMRSEGRGHSIFWYIMMTIVVFCYIYQFNLEVFRLPAWFHSVRLSALMLYILFGIHLLMETSIKERQSEGLRFYKSQIILHVFLFIYMLFLYFAIGIREGDHMVVILLNFFFIRLIPIYFCFKMFKSLDELMYIVLAATLLQTVFIWISLLFPSLGTIIDLTFNASDEFIAHRVGYAGGLGCITAPGYLRYSLGQIACFYLFTRKNKSLYIILSLLLLVTGTMIARTGLFVGLIVVLFMILYTLSKKGGKGIISIGIVSLVLIAVASVLLSNSEVFSFFSERYTRMTSLAEESQDSGFFNSSFFDNYMHGEGSVLPEFSFATIIGTGVPSGTAGNGVKVNIDGGYLRLYVAYGFILAVFFYFYLYRSMIKVARKEKNKEIRYTLILIIVILILAEYKEWAFYSSPFIWLFSVFAILAAKERAQVSTNSI